jgi:hypothetical protein
MHGGPVLRNSLIVAMLPIVLAVVGVIIAAVLPLAQWANGAEGPAGRGDEARSAVAGEAAAPSGPSDQTETADSREISALVRQLGDPTYAVRQRATKRLIELGIITQPLLTQALEDDDAEVRSRAGQVLAQVVEADFHLRLEAFTNDLEGRQQHTLPCWGRFSHVFGQDKISRMLFVEMQRSEPAMLEALDTNPKLAGELFVMRIQSIRQSLQFPARDGTGPPTISLGTVCSLLMVSAAEGVTVSDQDAMQLSALIKQPTFQRNLSANLESGILKKMLGAWIVHNSSSALARDNLSLAFTFDLKEGLDLAVKLLANDGRGQPPAIRHDALLTVGRFGNHTHIGLVEPLLKDNDFCAPQQGNDERQPQIRDVALAVLIHLSGQELKDYGLDHVQLNFQTLPQGGAIAFADKLTRKLALRKWEQWSGRGGAGPAGKPAAAKDTSYRPADAKAPATGSPVPAAAGATTPAPAARAAQQADAPAAKVEPTTTPRPAELVP